MANIIKMNQERLLNSVIESRRQFDRYIFYFVRGSKGDFVPDQSRKLSNEQMTSPVLQDGWSVKDLLAYLVEGEQSWLAWYNSNMDPHSEAKYPPPIGIISGVEQVPPDHSKASTLEQIIEEYRTSFPQLIVTIQSIPNEILLKPGNTPWTGNISLADTLIDGIQKRYDWAKGIIRKYHSAQKLSQRNKLSLIESIQSEHGKLDKTLAELTIQDWLTEGIIGSWTAKDIIAHLAAWEGLFRNWYLAGLSGQPSKTPAPGYSWTQIDHLNDEIYQNNRERPLDDVQKEYKNSFQETLLLVQSIPEDDIYTPGRFPWTGKILLEDYITANTSNHYRWARSKIRLWQKTKQSENR